MEKLTIVLAMVTALIGEPALAQQPRFPKANLEEMFANIQTQTTWDIKGNCFGAISSSASIKANWKRLAANW